MSTDKSGIEQAKEELLRAKEDRKKVVAQRPEVRQVAVKAYQSHDEFAELVIRAFEMRAS